MIDKLKNTQTQYGYIAIFFHWLMAMLVIAMLCLGLYMIRLPLGGEKLRLYGWHKQLGILILSLVIIRYGWRFINLLPELPINMPYWEKLAARSAHWLLYGLMVAMPLSGWMMTSAAGLPVSFFGLFTLPDLVTPDKNLFGILREVHMWLAYGLIATICLHVAAAFKHHFYNKDDILMRMLRP